MPVAYTTRAGLDSSNVGSIARGNESYELHEALEEGGGYVVVADDDTLLQVVLDEHPAMKRTTLKAAEEALQDAEQKAARSASAQKAAETRKANESEG
jgi:tRNA(Leu) C34 or U34 (ribose-2'-O)-methylase TrmL